jgi:hypothetical protein
MFKGPVGTASGRTPRSIAEEKNDAKSFDEGPKYDYAAGHAVTAKTPEQSYKEQPLKAPTPEGPKDIPAPFTIKGA